MQKQATEIVLTGGPCAGKTSALSYIREKLMDNGYRVFICPEVATLVIAGGVHDMGHLARNEPQRFFEVQCEMLCLQMELRRAFNELARIVPGDKKVIIYDRGPMDGKAYIGEAPMNEVLRRTGFALAETRDSFNAVIHLTTAALGAESFYSLANNSARRETLEEARELDAKTAAAWIGTPHLRVVDNSTDFEGKMRRMLREVCHVLGLPMPLEIERKFLLDSMPDLMHPDLGQVVAVEIEQIYLMSGHLGTRRIRRRGIGEGAVFFETLKTDVAPGVRHEVEKIITAEEYLRLASFRNPHLKTIRKRRHCFLYRNQYFELDEIYAPVRMTLLEIELTEENQESRLPPFPVLMRDVTRDPRYSNFNIASR